MYSSDICPPMQQQEFQVKVRDIYYTIKAPVLIGPVSIDQFTLDHEVSHFGSYLFKIFLSLSTSRLPRWLARPDFAEEVDDEFIQQIGEAIQQYYK